MGTSTCGSEARLADEPDEEEQVAFGQEAYALQALLLGGSRLTHPRKCLAAGRVWLKIPIVTSGLFRILRIVKRNSTILTFGHASRKPTSNGSSAAPTFRSHTSTRTSTTQLPEALGDFGRGKGRGLPGNGGGGHRPRQTHCNVGYSHKRHRPGYEQSRDRIEGVWAPNDRWK